MLVFRNFGFITKSTIQYESLDKTLLETSSTESMTSHTLFQNTFIWRKPRLAIFADIIKIVTMFYIYICIFW